MNHRLTCGSIDHSPVKINMALDVDNHTDQAAAHHYLHKETTFAPIDHHLLGVEDMATRMARLDLQYGVEVALLHLFAEDHEHRHSEEEMETTSERDLGHHQEEILHETVGIWHSEVLPEITEMTVDFLEDRQSVHRERALQSHQ